MPLNSQPTARRDPFAPEGEDVSDAEIVPAASTELALPADIVERINNAPWAEDQDAAFSIGMQVLNAASAEQVGSELESRSVRDQHLVNVPLELRSFEFAPSSFVTSPKSCPVVAYVTAASPDGELVTFTIGNWGPTMQLLRWNELKAFPLKVKIIEIPSRTAGFNPALRFVML